MKFFVFSADLVNHSSLPYDVGMALAPGKSLLGAALKTYSMDSVTACI